MPPICSCTYCTCQNMALCIRYKVMYSVHFVFIFIFDHLQNIRVGTNVWNYFIFNSGIEVDLNVNNAVGIRNTQLLSSYARCKFFTLLRFQNEICVFIIFLDLFIQLCSHYTYILKWYLFISQFLHQLFNFADLKKDVFMYLYFLPKNSIKNIWNLLVSSYFSWWKISAFSFAGKNVGSTSWNKWC